MRGGDIDEVSLNAGLLVSVEMPFVASRKIYDTRVVGESLQIGLELNEKYRQ